MDCSTSNNFEINFSDIPTKLNILNNSKFKSMMTDNQRESQTPQQVPNINEPLSFSSLCFSSESNAPTSLAIILGKIYGVMISDQPAQPADAFNFDFAPFTPLPVESSSSARSQKFSEGIQSIDQVIKCFDPCNNKTDESLEPIPLFHDMKRGLEEELSSQGPAIKKQKAGKTTADENFFRSYQAEQWTQRFEELCNFVRDNGNCQVPHTFTKNPALARWVKR